MMKDHYVVIGYGDVGRAVVEVLQGKTELVVVDRHEDQLKKLELPYVVGNGVEEDTLERAGIKDARMVMILLNNDTDVVFTTLLVKNMNPHAVIIARANTVEAIERIYRAGADFVAALPIMAGELLAKLVTTTHELEDVVRLCEGIEIFKYEVCKGSPMIGHNLADLDVRRKTGCTVIGIKRGEEVIAEITAATEIQEGDIVAVIGYEEQIEQFKKLFGSGG
ncbi:MAG: potassium channel protein [Candidatus Syntrophoarchaeum caldarius]|uniref:Potassium channel protein n=1 Tax=Candidatus Syntropharchaeum caldarium TaxID=1838285 RepID=A0A1F2P934_9EURY|nr:MAG: potassium channel protein [Candidatus Syntrophoarchaeum caldarius]